MKRRLLPTLVVPLLVLLAACSSVNELPDPAADLLEPDATPVPLHAEGDVPVGTVSASDDGTTLTVTYDVTEPGWCLMETHLSVSTRVDDAADLDPLRFTGHDFAPGVGHDFAPGDGHDKHHDEDDGKDEGWKDWDDDLEDWIDWGDDDGDDGYGDGHDDEDDEDKDEDDDHDEDRDDDGYGDGYDDGYGDGYDDGYGDGYDDGYGDGYGDGHDDGRDDGDDKGETPEAPSGGEQPDPYAFPFRTQHDCVGTYGYEIALDDLGEELGDKLIVAAHAVVAGRESDDGGTGQCTTGMYGVERDSGAIYRIDDVPGQVFEQVAALDDSPGDGDLPDGLALDAGNGRLYLADEVAGVTELTSYDLASGTFTAAGTLQGSATGAAFHDGGYYYVPFATNELHRVTFAADGSVAAEEVVAGFVPPAALEVVDLAFDAGVMYGSTTVRASGSADSTARFFSFDLASATFTTLASASGGAYLQLAFAEDGTLYGTYTDDTVFYAIDPVTGASEPLEFWPQANFTDLASSFGCDAVAEPDTGGDPTITVSAWAGEKYFEGAGNGARFFVYALSWASP